MANCFLKNLPRDQLAIRLRPVYDTFYEQLTPEQQSKISFEAVVSGSYSVLRGGSARGGLMAVPSFPAPLPRAGVSSRSFALGMVATDVFAILFQVAGINEPQSRAAARAIMEELGDESLRGVHVAIRALNIAMSVTVKADLLWNIAVDLYGAIGISRISEALKRSMHWCDWISTGATIVVQLITWFGSDGVAFVGELASETAYVARFQEGVVKAIALCG